MWTRLYNASRSDDVEVRSTHKGAVTRTPLRFDVESSDKSEIVTIRPPNYHRRLQPPNHPPQSLLAV